MNKKLKDDNLPNDVDENIEDKSKVEASEQAEIQCRRHGSIITIDFIPKSIDDLKGLTCPYCGGDEFDIL